MNEISKYVGIAALLFAIIFGAAVAGEVEFATKYSAQVSIALVIAGILVGILSVSDMESVPVMVAVLVLGLGSASLAIFSGQTETANVWIQAIFGKIAALVVPTGIVVALITLGKKFTN